MQATTLAGRTIFEKINLIFVTGYWEKERNSH